MWAHSYMHTATWENVPGSCQLWQLCPFSYITESHPASPLFSADPCQDFLHSSSSPMLSPSIFFTPVRFLWRTSPALKSARTQPPTTAGWFQWMSVDTSYSRDLNHLSCSTFSAQLRSNYKEIANSALMWLAKSPPPIPSLCCHAQPQASASSVNTDPFPKAAKHVVPSQL